MLDQDTVLDVLAACDRRRDERRRFMKMAGGATAAVGGLSLLAACGGGDDDNNSGGTPTPSPTPSPSPTTSAVDIDVLNFALNLEYLEATFYSYAAFGSPLSSASVGTSPGTVTGGRKVAFQDTLVERYAREIAGDEVAHVNFLRQALGSAAVSLPALNIDGGANGAFTAAARAAGVITANQTFDPYADDQSFLLGAYIFEDVGVTAYKGGSKLLVSPVYLEAAAGILAAEAYHAGLVRTVLYGKGIRTPADQISDARDSLDGSDDLDQGISSTDGGLSSNLVPTDGNGIAFSRDANQVLNIVYLNKNAVSSGGFFPAGLNGNIKTSRAN